MEYLPSIACADPINLERDIEELSSLGFSCLHFDIMDNHYVRNLCLSFDIGKRIKERFPAMELDVHVMVESPEDYVDRVAEMGGARFAFHLDSTRDAKTLIKRTKDLGMLSAAALNPEQSIRNLLPIISELDFVLMMSIRPGFPGAQFIENTFSRVQELDTIRKEHNPALKISVDGGIRPETAKELGRCGADMLVLGYFIMFRQHDSISEAWRRNFPLMQ